MVFTMNFDIEILNALKYEAALSKTIIPAKTLDDHHSRIKEDFAKRKIAFSDMESKTITKNGKKRFIKQYAEKLSSQNILSHCIKKILDRSFKIQYPNRNKKIKSLFNILKSVLQMSDFTIVKFDFKDYFNSISVQYVLNKIIINKINDRLELDLLKDFADKTRYAYTGLKTSNAIAEIIASFFDSVLKKELLSRGLLFYERYIDDVVMIFNENISETEIKSILDNNLLNVFHDKKIECTYRCKTKFNKNKFKYISKKFPNTQESFDYLGYEFFFCKNSNNLSLKYGITLEKRDKYERNLKNLIAHYKNKNSSDYDNLELLRHRIIAFTSRQVYLNKKFKSNIWKVKGFIANYAELRFVISADLLEKGTEDFLKTIVSKHISTLPCPYKLHKYSLYDNMKKNKTLLLVNNVGYNYNALVNLCSKVDISCNDSNGKKRGYGNLVREYLIKVKVGY